MPDLSTALALDPVKQFSVYAENRVGRLYDLCALFKTHHVQVVALTVLDTTDSAILRLIVDDNDKARELMINNDFPFSETSVLAVEFEGEDRLKDVLAALLEAEINIHYIYSFLFRPSDARGLIIKTEDFDVAAQALSNCGFKVLTHHDIAR